MATISRFEDIEAWKDARALVKHVYAATNQGPFARDFGLRDQIRRSAVSIMANIAEGFERKNSKELAYFLRVARGSCAEVQSHLYVAIDADLISKEEFQRLQSEAAKTGRKISGFQRYLKSSTQESGSQIRDFEPEDHYNPDPPS